MSLHEEHDYHSFTEYEDKEEITHKKKIKRLLEARLERKRLKEEFMDDFDELSGEFDWGELDK